MRLAAAHDRTLRLRRIDVGCNPWPIEWLETSPVDPEPDHLLVQCAPGDLEALQRRPDVAAGLQQALLNCATLEFLHLGRQGKRAGVRRMVLRLLLGLFRLSL